MKRKEIKAKTITQSNDASCHGSGNGHRKSDPRKKRHSSKVLRQVLAKDLLDQIPDDINRDAGRV